MRSNVEVIVIGGGISGLTLGYRLKQAGISVLVCEAELKPGGKIQSHSENGFLWEAGPNTLQRKDQDLWQLISELTLSSRVVYANPRSKRRFIVRNGKLVALPCGPFSFFTSSFLSLSGKRALLGEYSFQSKNGHQKNETVDQFMRRHFGPEAAEYLVDPFVKGIYAGNAAEVILDSAFPRLRELEKSHGSLVKGFLQSRRKDKSSPKFPSPLYSFDTGLEALPQSLAKALGESIEVDTRIMEIGRRPDGGYELAVEHEGKIARVSADQVVLTLPALEASALISSLHPHCSEKLAALKYPGVAVVYTTHRRENVKHRLNGFGVLCPSKESRFILGSLWSSSLFESRAPSGYVALTAMVGGASNPERAELSEEELLKGVCQDYRELFGITNLPTSYIVTRWPRAIPQYTLHQQEAVQAIETAEAEISGLYLSGNYRAGVSVGACVREAIRLAKVVQKTQEERRLSKRSYLDVYRAQGL